MNQANEVCSLRCNFYDAILPSQVERQSASYPQLELRANFRSLSDGGFWMWKWGMDAGYED